MPNPSKPEPATGVTADASTFTIRRMRWFDVEAVAELDHVAFGPDTWNLEFFWAQLAGPANRFWVVEDVPGPDRAGSDHAGSLLGYAGLSIAGGESEILTIATAPQARGRGVAKALIRTMMDTAVSRGVDAMYLDVRDGNAAALGLYRACGFAELSRRPGYYHGADAIIMRAHLR